MSKPFQRQYTFEERKSEADRILAKYPDKIPIIVELGRNSNLSPLDKQKYLVPYDLSVAQFMFMIRKRLKLSQEQAMFLFINDKLPITSQLLSILYPANKSDDGFLYITLMGETTFGCSIDLPSINQ
jgi:GABA(A) receptor-associated protein